MRIGFIGGTGTEAKGLALRFAKSGVPVILGSRSAARATQKAEEYGAQIGSSLIRGMVNEEMIRSTDIVFISVPFQEARVAVESYRSLFTAEHVLVDVTVPLVFRAGRPEYLEQEGRSNAEIVAGALPSGVPLTAAFKTVPAALLADVDTDLNCDVFICGDSEQAKAKLISAAEMIPGVRPLDAGLLQAARTVERMAVLAIALNRRYKKKGARFRVVGI